MSNFFSFASPMTFFIVGCVFLVVLIGMLCWSINYYWRAKEIAPFLYKIQELKELFKTLSANVGFKQKELEGLISERQTALREIADGKLAKEYLEAHAGEVERKQVALESLNQKIKDSNASLKDAEEKLALKREELRDVAEETNQMEAKRLATQATLELLEARERSLKEIIARLPKLEEQERNLQNSIAKLLSEKESLENKINNLREQINRLNEDCEKKDREVSDTKQKLADLRSNLAELNGQIASAKETYGKYIHVKQNVKEVWKELETPLMECVSKTRKIKIKDDSETLWLRKFTSQLMKYGFEFNERMLNAFHTGLKCADATPLVVLAGISGTGKSLLPELYAHYAGMNFLSVPVQPRWDGPQDLMGFYNYMEQRYKATELCRFLWQADSWNNADGEAFFTEDALNIVLLDEMNLARVEYYFSDFLSKLEQRRGIDSSDELQRQKAEILLECGAGQGELGKRSLFVDDNVFFVGTMNEDETTQMLSDKVVDRSNLLRFGRPAQLRAAPRKGEFLTSLEKCPRVTKKIWKNWQDIEINEAHRYSDEIRILNEAFSSVGRPFGHRVTQSIAAYLAYYPKSANSDLAEQYAFADQIEMKLLPKLNGLELATPGFDSVKNKTLEIIKETGDGELEAAFNNAVDISRHTFFRWRGVMRNS